MKKLLGKNGVITGRRTLIVMIVIGLIFAFLIYAVNQLTLADMRSDYETKVSVKSEIKVPLPNPPINLFVRDIYDSDGMRLASFVSPDPDDNQKHPAIVWITGGESNTLDDFWTMRSEDNDQTASPYRDAGIIMMFPTLRGGNENSGVVEVNYGEVDDVIAAAKHLATLPYVDADRIYLGGHSTGGTLALLVSEVVSITHPELFKEVISFGATQQTMFLQEPIIDGDEDYREMDLRTPANWTNDILIPTWVIEGKSDSSNYEDLSKLCADSDNQQLHCAFIPKHNHFSVLYPVNRIIAQQILNNQPINIDPNAF